MRRWGMGKVKGEYVIKGEGRDDVVLALGSHGVVNQVDHMYLTFCHCYVPPSFEEDREVVENHLQLS